MTVAIFGKLPFASDFLRYGVSKDTRPLEDWVHEGYADLRRAGAKGLPGRSHLICPGPSGAIAAVAIPSRDRVGREFPAVVLTTIAWARLPLHASSMTVSLERFWSDCESVVERCAGRDGDALWASLQTVRPPSDEELSAGERERASILAETSARAMEATCFTEPDDRFYAYHTLRLATKTVPPPEPRVLLCPSGNQRAYRLFWADAVSRASSRGAALSFLWMDDGPDPGALVVGLGRNHRGMLKFAAGHGESSNALWPLTTRFAPARSRARDALGGGGWESSEETLSGLIERILEAEVQ